MPPCNNNAAGVEVVYKDTTVSEAVQLEAERCEDSVQCTALRGVLRRNQHHFWSLLVSKVTGEALLKAFSFTVLKNGGRCLPTAAVLVTFAVKSHTQRVVGENNN